MAKKEMTAEAVETLEAAALRAALQKVNQDQELEETAESLQDSQVYLNLKVVLVLSDFRKFTYTWAELGLAAAGRLPETLVKQ